MDPSVELTPPVAHALIPPALDFYLHIGDLVSLGHWALVAIDFMGGPNIPQEVGEWFAGDWQEVSRAADALTKLGAFCSTASDGVKAEITRLERSWEGEASEAAVEYFTGLSSVLWQMKPNFDDIADQFQDTAFGVKELANAAGSLVETLADLAIVAGVSLAAAFASSWTGVGAAIGTAAAEYAVVRGVLVVKELLEIRAKVWNVCEAVLGLIAGSLSALEGFSTVPLPAGYDNLLVQAPTPASGN